MMFDDAICGGDLFLCKTPHSVSGAKDLFRFNPKEGNDKEKAVKPSVRERLLLPTLERRFKKKKI